MLKLNEALGKGAIYIEKNKKTIKNFSKIPLYNDEPQVFAYSTTFKSSKGHPDGNATGVSYNKNKALMKVFGETIERIALSEYKSKFLYTSYNNIKKSAIKPTVFSPFSKEQLKRKSYKDYNFNENTNFQWTKAFSFLNQKEVYVPAQLVYVPFHLTKGEPVIREIISTGAAAGSSLEDAIYRGICEIVERDSFMIGYLNKLNLPQIDTTYLKNPLITKILKNLERYNLECFLIDSTTDIKIPSIIALIIDRTEKGPSVSVGLKAGFDIEENIIGAIEEGLMGRAWLRDEIYYGDRKKKHEHIKDFYDRGLYWFPTNMIRKLDFWIKSKNKINLKKIKIKNEQKLEEALKRMLRFSDVLYADITPKNVKRLGFSVVKVIIPKLFPVYLDEELKYRGIKRLYETPVCMKYLKHKPKEKELNSIPHPFL